MTAAKIKLILLVICISFDIAGQDKNFTDTINIIDATGKKQGHWIVLGQSKPNTCYQPVQKVEEGFYKDNKKTGVWTEYYCNGNKKNTITFSDGRPDGPATMWYIDGKIAEEGTYKNRQWIGEYKLYNQDGNFKEYYYDDKGIRHDVSPSPNLPHPKK